MHLRERTLDDSPALLLLQGAVPSYVIAGAKPQPRRLQRARERASERERDRERERVRNHPLPPVPADGTTTAAVLSLSLTLTLSHSTSLSRRSATTTTTHPLPSSPTRLPFHPTATSASRSSVPLAVSSRISSSTPVYDVVFLWLSIFKGNASLSPGLYPEVPRGGLSLFFWFGFFFFFTLLR
ncbi:hypothetical protein VTO42DRAFT_5888 [Malbranchea cinnamomea]